MGHYHYYQYIHKTVSPLRLHPKLVVKYVILNINTIADAIGLALRNICFVGLHYHGVTRCIYTLAGHTVLPCQLQTYLYLEVC